MGPGPLYGKREKSNSPRRLLGLPGLRRVNLTMSTPRGEDLDKLSMANALAEWLYFSKLTGSIEQEEYNKWKLCVDRIPGAGEYLQLLSAPEYNNLQGKVLRDFASKVKRKTWP